jgi:imidazoleglycerol-phosphate dehydratase/histidinol-phosphatase
MYLGTPFAPFLVDQAFAFIDEGEESASVKDLMANYYNIDVNCLLVTRGASHGLELVLRYIGGQAGQFAVCEDNQYEDIFRAYKMPVRKPDYGAELQAGALIYLINNPKAIDGKTWRGEEARALALQVFPNILVVDESYIDVAPENSLVNLTRSIGNLVVLRNMAYVTGAANCQIGALISSRQNVQLLNRFCELSPLPCASLRQAAFWLTSDNRQILDTRLNMMRGEQMRMRTILVNAPRPISFELNNGPFLVLRPQALLPCQLSLNDLQLKSYLVGSNLIVPLGYPEANNLILKVLGLNVASPRVSNPLYSKRPRTKRPSSSSPVTCGHGVRVKVDFEKRTPVEVRTGNGFFDHMLEQMAVHGEFSLQIIPDRPHTELDCPTLEDIFSVFVEAIITLLPRSDAATCVIHTRATAGQSVYLRLEPGKGSGFQTEMRFDQVLIGTFPTRLAFQCLEVVARALDVKMCLHGSGADDYERVETCFNVLGIALKQVAASTEDNQQNIAREVGRDP